MRLEKQVKTMGWRPTCACADAEPIACTVLDPFAGSGTTLMVASKLGRNAVGIELKPEYQSLIQDRCREQPDIICAA